MRGFKYGVIVGGLAVASIAALPVFAQSDDDLAASSSSADQSAGPAASGPPSDSGNQTPLEPQHRPAPPPGLEPPHRPAPPPGMPRGHRPPPPPVMPRGHRPPPPGDGVHANGNPLQHVCLNKSDAYSPGAVVMMNQKPYQCKALGDDTSGVLHWVPIKNDS